MKKSLIAFTAFIIILSQGCASLSPEESEGKRNELILMANQTVSTLKNKHPFITEELDNVLAYGVTSMKLTKVPIIGAGGGEGVLITKGSERLTYFNIERIDFGGGWCTLLQCSDNIF